MSSALGTHQVRATRWLVWCLALVFFSPVLAAPASAQEEPPLGLRPDYGGPRDTFVVTYDVGQGGCRYPDGRLVSFYWFGGSSGMTMLGRAQLVNCVAWLSTTPPAGTSAGEYVVGADVLYPSGSQRPQSGRYRVDPAARPRSMSSPLPPPGSSSNRPGLEPTLGGETGGPSGPAWALMGPSPGPGPGPVSPAQGPGDGGQGPGGPAQGDAAVPPPVSEGGASPGAAAAEPAPPDCGKQEVDCRAGAPETASQAGSRPKGPVVLVVLAVVALLTGLVLVWRRRLHDRKGLVLE